MTWPLGRPGLVQSRRPLAALVLFLVTVFVELKWTPCAAAHGLQLPESPRHGQPPTMGHFNGTIIDHVVYCWGAGSCLLGQCHPALLPHPSHQAPLVTDCGHRREAGQLLPGACSSPAGEAEGGPGSGRQRAGRLSAILLAHLSGGLQSHSRPASLLPPEGPGPEGTGLPRAQGICPVPGSVPAAQSTRKRGSVCPAQPRHICCSCVPGQSRGRG